jgi:hypothetical protein
MPRLLALVLATPLAFAAGCGPSVDPKVAGAKAVVDRWMVRAQSSFKAGDLDDAREAAQAALKAAPKDASVRVLNARLALARLDFAEVLRLTEGLRTSEALGLRGRAYWYQGDLEQAADELEAMLGDPAVKDPWARDVAGLARRGTGRHPFSMEGDLVAAVDMPESIVPVVQVELDGENMLALVAMGSGEVVLDSNSRREPSWVSLRFAGRHGAMEVHDVPALTQDLSALSRQFGAPVKALLGVNLLRHVHATVDRRGDQFVVRRQEPGQPPDGTRVPFWYLRGEGAVVRLAINLKADERALFRLDSTNIFPLSMEDDAWRRAGVDPGRLSSEPSRPGLKTGAVPGIRLGSFDLPNVPAVGGPAAMEGRVPLEADIAGVVGAGLLQAFRVTFAEDGRVAWFEPDPLTAIPPQGASGAAVPSGRDAEAGAKKAPMVPDGNSTTKAPAGKTPKPSGEKNGSGAGAVPLNAPSTTPTGAPRPAGSKP